MGTRTMSDRTDIPPPPPGFDLIPPPPAGFEMIAEPSTPSVSPAAGARAAAEEQPMPRDRSTLDYITGLARQAAQGVTYNYGDEVAATLGAVGGKLPGGHGKDRETLLRELRGEEAEFKRENPKAALGAEIGGALAGGLGTGALAARAVPWLAAAPGVARTALGAGVTGAAGSALDATGRAEGEIDLGDVGQAAGIGAGAGAAVGGAGRMVANVAGPWLSAQARQLHDMGVRMTPGQMIGGAAQRIEDAAGSIPFAGALVRARQGDAVESLNRAAYDRALEPITRTAPRTGRVSPNTDVGHDAVQEMTDILGRRYGVVVPRMRANFDTAITHDIATISRNLPQAVRPQYADAIRRHIEAVIDPTTGDIDGRGLQNAFQGLRREARRMQRSQAGAYDYDLGEALNQTHAALTRAAARRTNTRTMGDFRRLNEAYGNFAVVRDAASRAGSETGEFTPSGFHAAVRAADKSAGKGNMARGTARMQDLSDPAKAVMKQRVGDSGTAERAALVAAILAPSVAMKSIAPVAALALAYTRPGNAAFRGLGTAGLGTRDALKRAMVQAGIPVGMTAGRTAADAGPEGLSEMQQFIGQGLE
jgi:hypothetical protein